MLGLKLIHANKSGHWCLSDAMSQDISNHDTDILLSEIFQFLCTVGRLNIEMSYQYT